MGNQHESRRSTVSRVLSWALVFFSPTRKEAAQTADPDLQPGRSPSHPDEVPHLSSLVSLSIIFFFSLAFVAWGLFVYHTVGTRWPPPWSFGEVQDLPGASAYSTESKKRFLGPGPERFQTGPPAPQHVMEKPVPGAAK